MPVASEGVFFGRWRSDFSVILHEQHGDLRVLRCLFQYVSVRVRFCMSFCRSRTSGRPKLFTHFSLV